MKPDFLGKKIDGPNLGSAGLNQAQNQVFRNFIGFGSHVFLEIAYYDSLRQCPTSNRDKTDEKTFGSINLGQTGQNRAIFSSLVH